MKEEKSSLILRKWTKQLFLGLFLRSGLTPNQLTTINFLVTSVPSVYFLATGHNVIALLLILINVPIDFLDGEVAKATGQMTKLGAYLDTSLDWIWQLSLLGAMVYRTNLVTWGLVAIISTVYSNYLSATSRRQLDDFPFVMKYYMFGGILFNKLDWALVVIAIAYSLKVVLTGYSAIKERM